MGEVLKEAQSINKSLSALGAYAHMSIALYSRLNVTINSTEKTFYISGDVIAALTSNQQHVPYRNHPLTMLMSDTIGGNSKTLIFINASPADYNVTIAFDDFLK
jgi:hypothetical protein